MKQSISILAFCIQIAILLVCSLAKANTGDTIKPLPQLNKEFLIVAHIVLDKNGKFLEDTNAIKAQLNLVNGIFKPISASFRICEFRFIPNFNYDSASFEYRQQTVIKYSVENRINMFFVGLIPPKKNPLTCGIAVLGGVTYKHNDGIFIVCPEVITMAHELGHFFNLTHTFQGSGEELADGSNCATAGDGLCDTPADPYISGEHIYNHEYISTTIKCLFIKDKKDAKGNYYDPDVSNIMSYYTPCICNKFSHDQYEKMAKYYLKNPFTW